MPTRLRLIVNEREWDAELSPRGVSLGDDAPPVVVRDDGEGRVRVDTESEPIVATAALAGDVVWVGIDGALFVVRVARADAPGASSARDADALSPPMAATVVRIAVQPGATVRQGDTLVVLEAMKMELPIRAPRDGVIAAVRCREGELVQPGVPVVEMSHA